MTSPSRHSGAALLVVLLILILGGLGWFLQQAPAPAIIKSERDQATAQAMAKAKEALLGYAAYYPESNSNPPDTPHPRKGFVPGHLPCPDTGNALENEGAEAGTCEGKGISVIGHFPWRSLGAPPPRDGEGECLWYAVSGNHKANPKADLLNPDSDALLTIVTADGTVLAEQVVAVLFSPGAPLPGQQRAYTKGECRWDYDASRFLDTLNGVNNSAPNAASEGISRFIIADANATFNDRLLWITRDELFARVEARMPPDALFAEHYPDNADALALTQRVATCLMRFGEDKGNTHHRLPWAAPPNLTAAAPETFHFDRFADANHLLAGRAPYSVSRSQEILQGALLSACPASNRTHSACRLLVKDACPDFLPVAGRPDNGDLYNSHNGWWDKWKDHLFYVVAPGFAPKDAAAADCAATPDECLQVGGHLYAAAVIFAGAPLAGQTRQGASAKMQIANYLEGENLITLQSGGKKLERAGNDRIACIAYHAEKFSLVPNCE
ncbi:hypothetical protein AGMMS49545_21510 [Betaproteobacteria bacterium]|nr:hypothetical protein AGMMS49545_21510 [Betaproteobacteria bacterium]GHU40103.1 hypothetical protein AGMMS50289_01160 [Betaproteobacteria bacterium]